MSRSKKPEKPRVALVSLGCPKNLVDSEVILGRLGDGSLDFVVAPEEADIAIVNTCGFIDAARDESLGTIDELLSLKRAGKLRGVIVAGCMVKRYRDRLAHERPEIDALLDISDYADVSAAVRGILTGRDVRRLSGGQAKTETADLGRLLLTPEHFAYLRISEGCDYKCSFCVIPRIRGQLRSKPLALLEEEVRQLADLGVKEIALIAEDTTAYGRDLRLEGGLRDLLRRLARISGIEWIRVLYAHPLTIDAELVEELSDNPKVLPYLDMPIQHADDALLRAMRRGTSSALLARRIDELRDRIPRLALRTSVIVGFPGETEAAFERLLAFLREARFARVGCFTYSEEEGSAAAQLEDSVPPALKEERRERVMLEAKEVIQERNRSLEGARVKVILDAPTGEGFVGRTEADAPEIDCAILLEGHGQPGQIREAEVTGMEGYDLLGRLVPAFGGDPRDRSKA